MMFGTIPEGLEDHHEQILCCDEFTRHAIDRYLALISLADRVMTVDSLALHVAMGLNKQGNAYFSLSPPEIRLRYAPQINGYLIPDAQALPYWGKHKSDEAWSEYSALYEQAWERLEVGQVF
jgi:ADP-heptose:LPS heptosyltransferase